MGGGAVKGIIVTEADKRSLLEKLVGDDSFSTNADHERTGDRIAIARATDARRCDEQPSGLCGAVVLLRICRRGDLCVGGAQTVAER